MKQPRLPSLTTNSRYRGDVGLAQLNDPVRRYIAATMRARSVPTANQQVLNALKG